MHFCIIVSTLLYLLHFLSLHKSLVYPPFVYILYDECTDDVTGEYSPAKYQRRNWGALVCGWYVPHTIFSLFYEKEELRKYFSMITHATCLFSMITQAICLFSMTSHANCLFFMITHAISLFSVIAHPICLFSIITHGICLFSVIAHPICLFSMITHAICLFAMIAHVICLFFFFTYAICLFLRDSTCYRAIWK